MIIDKVAPELEKVGLTAKESRTYLAALELGPSTAQIIAARAGVNRPTTYIAIESLVKRGLMSSINKGKKRYFVAEPPENIFGMLRDQERELKQRERIVEGVMGDLSVLAMGAKDRPVVTFYEGLRGVDRMRETVLKAESTEMLEFSPLDIAHKYFPRTPDDHRRRFRSKKRSRLIYTSSREQPRIEGTIETRRICADRYPFSGDVSVCGNLVNIINWEPEVICVQIVHEQIAQVIRQMFELAWRSLEKEEV